MIFKNVHIFKSYEFQCFLTKSSQVLNHFFSTDKMCPKVKRTQLSHHTTVTSLAEMMQMSIRMRLLLHQRYEMFSFIQLTIKTINISFKFTRLDQILKQCSHHKIIQPRLF